MKRLIRRPSPDLTTACATMKAITTSSTLALAKPENACAGVIVPVRTTVPTAIIAAVRKEIKKRHDSIEAFTKGGRPDQAAKEQAEVKILESYLPQAMPEAELEALVKSVIAELQATDKKAMGAVMKACQAKSAGRADNRALSALVGKLLP